MTFEQQPPFATNRFTFDRALNNTLRRLLGEDIFKETSPLLHNLGELARTDFLAMQDLAEANPPRHIPFDAWGRRVDRIEVSDAWLDLVKEGQRFGIVATPHERKHGDASRVVQFGLMHLYLPVTAMADCPLAMTDAAVATLKATDKDLANKYVPRLVAREDAWTSGQWMTEREGGSDVGRTSTVAVQTDGVWRLYGTKWFTSATTADMALVLARPEGAESGSKGLSLFALELRNEDGTWNGIRVRRLKDKLGTRALPTAELELDGAVATPVGGIGRGVAKVATMLNVTRLHAACGANSHVGYALGLAREYAKVREAFGRRIADLPAHRMWMAQIASVYEAGLLMVARAAQLTGEAEAGRNEALARIVLPLTKFCVTRQSADLASQLIESFGGAGYVEDTGLPRILRDVHVQVIWEGTTTIMALDTLRALSSSECGAAFVDDIDVRLSPNSDESLRETREQVRIAAKRLATMLEESSEENVRTLAWNMSRVYQAALLCEGGNPTAARLFAATPLIDEHPPLTNEELGDYAFISD